MVSSKTATTLYLAVTALVFVVFVWSVVTTEIRINRGQALFVSETFDGNGRTCATCHAPAESFSISPATIRSLPSTDPLFVDVPGLENPVKLREDGLILVNDPDDGILEFRPTPKLTHLRRLCSRNGKCGPLGVRGDRERDLCTFSNEAVGNHFTKRVNGTPGVDFRLLTKRECKDMIAFLTSRRVEKAGDRED